MILNVKVFNQSLGPEDKVLALPDYATPGDDGIDLKACYNCEQEGEQYFSVLKQYAPDNCKTEVRQLVDEDYVLYPHHRVLIPTGLYIELPKGYKLSIKSFSRSLKTGIVVFNSPGTIDNPYRGNVGVILFNDTDVPYIIKHGDEIAQASIEQSNQINWVPVKSLDELSVTERADGSYGHSDENTPE